MLRSFCSAWIKSNSKKGSCSEDQASTADGVRLLSEDRERQVSAFYIRKFCFRYADLPAEERTKKLEKKFAKLDEDKREIFEKLALVR